MVLLRRLFLKAKQNEPITARQAADGIGCEWPKSGFWGKTDFGKTCLYLPNCELESFPVVGNSCIKIRSVVLLMKEVH